MLRRLINAITVATIVGGLPCYAQTAAKPETEVARAQTAIDRGDPAGALVWYERVPVKAPERRDLLLRIAALRSRQLATDADVRVAVEACRAQVATGTKTCLTDARRIADDVGAEMGARLAAASVLVEGRADGAEAFFQTLLGIAAENKPAAAAGALAGRRADSSIQPLMQLAGNSNEDAKYIATLALVRYKTKDTVPVLRAVAADRDSGAARLIAYIGLAASGDQDALKILNDTLPLMKGRDLLEAGRALTTLKDPRGTAILRSLAQEGDEMLRIEAAEALYGADSALSARLIQSASDSANPWVRARALEAAATLRIAPTVSMRRAMLDTNSWVAVWAVQAVTADTVEPVKAR
jgi:HEAT repeat protein